MYFITFLLEKKNSYRFHYPRCFLKTISTQLKISKYIFQFQCSYI